MVIRTIAGVAAVLVVAAPLLAGQAGPVTGRAVSSFYDLKTTTLDAKPADLSQYRGDVSLVVNVASYCGYTPQYRGTRDAAPRARGKGLQCAWLSERRLRRAGTGHCRGNCEVLPAHLRCDVSDVREGRDATRRQAVARLRVSRPLRQPTRLEFQQVHRRQAGQRGRLLSERRHARRSSTSRRHPAFAVRQVAPDPATLVSRSRLRDEMEFVPISEAVTLVRAFQNAPFRWRIRSLSST